MQLITENKTLIRVALMWGLAAVLPLSGYALCAVCLGALVLEGVSAVMASLRENASDDKVVRDMLDQVEDLRVRLNKTEDRLGALDMSVSMWRP